MLLDGRVAVVTGGTRGLGREIAAEFLAEGALVVCASRTARDCTGLAQLGGDRLTLRTVDVRDPHSARELMAAAHDHFGRLDVLVANAGTSEPGSIPSADGDDWTDVVTTNLFGTFHCTQAAIPYLAKVGGGRIITLSSALAGRVAPGASAYSVAKAGIETFTRIAAIELAPQGITVNALAPGFIDVGMGTELRANETVWPAYERRLAMGRLGTGPEAARAAVFLAGPDSSYVNGHVLEVNGGLNW